MKRGKPFTADDPRRGRGPAKGAPGAGRKPDAFKDLCAGIVSSEAAIRAARAILADGNHPAFAQVFKALAGHAYGTPTKRVDLASAGSATAVVILPPRDR